MTILSSIISAIMGITNAAGITSPVLSKIELEAALDKRVKERGQAFNWRESIVDLLKLLNMDSSLEARRLLAIELGYTGTAADGSAEKNMWLQKAVLKKVSEQGIIVPANLL